MDYRNGVVKLGLECRAGGRLHSCPGGGGEDGHAHAAHLLHHHPLLDHLLSGINRHLQHLASCLFSRVRCLWALTKSDVTMKGRKQKKRKENIRLGYTRLNTLFSDHNGSLPRRQPGQRKVEEKMKIRITPNTPENSHSYHVCSQCAFCLS